MPDSKLDLSDIPESTDAELRYQTLIHELLEKSARKVA